MKKEVLIKSTIAMLLSVTATTFANASNTTTGKSRQEVINEMIEARRQGILDSNGDNYPDYGKQYPKKQGKSRQEVINEMIVYKKAGLLDIPEKWVSQNIEEIMITKVYKNTQ